MKPVSIPGNGTPLVRIAWGRRYQVLRMSHLSMVVSLPNWCTDILAEMQWHPSEDSARDVYVSQKCVWGRWLGFSVQHDAASEVVKKFPRILLRACAVRIEPPTCQNYLARVVSSARRDFFSRPDVRRRTVETRAPGADQLCIIAIKVRIRFPLSRHAATMKLFNSIDK